MKFLEIAKAHNADFNVSDNRRKTPLTDAAQGNQTEAIRFILETGINNSKAKDKRGNSALDYAKSNNNKEAVKLIEDYINSGN